MKISVISGVYNCEKYIGACIDSLINQTYSNIEIILVNNASVDNTQLIIDEYIKKYGSKIICYQTKEKLGPGGSRKKGMEYATGEYIAIVDCDDYVSVDYIQDMVSCAEINDLPDIVYADFSKVTNDGKILYSRHFDDENIARVQGIAPWAKMFKREFLIEKDLIFRNIPFGEDVIFNSEVNLINPRIAIAKEKGCYFWRNNFTSASHTEIREFPVNTIVKSSEYFEYMLKKYERKEKELEYYILKYYIWYLLQSGRNVNKIRMIQEYNNAFHFVEQHYPSWWKDKIHVPFGERNVVKCAFYGFKFLKRLNLLEIFLKEYTKLPMEKLWPSL